MIGFYRGFIVKNEANQEETCAGCKFCIRKERFLPCSASVKFLECHRFPPTIGRISIEWPEVPNVEWCGEFKFRRVF
jgi:hypothetical protein